MPRLLPLAALAALAATPVAAQTSGTLTGRISDAAMPDRSAGALPGVRLTATDACRVMGRRNCRGCRSQTP